MPSATIQTLEQKIQSLKTKLSCEASIVLASDPKFSTLASRWSDFGGPQPGALVYVATEEDVERTVTWATSNGVRFLAQGGGHGYTTTWNIGSNDIIINMCGMNKVTVDLEAGTAIIGAGTLVQEAIDAAHEAKAHIVAGTCNTVGVTGATLGGGLSRMQGLYGISADNMISARVVTAAGKCINVSATENSDLWYGLRGAGHGFGIVTSMKVKAYPQINEGTNFTSLLIFTPDKIETLGQLINDLEFNPYMSMNLFMMAAPPTFQPAVAVALWYAGTELDCREAFKSFYSAGAVFELSDVTPWDKVNAASDAMIAKGGLKPCTGTSLKKLNPTALRKAWETYLDFFAKNPDAAQSAIMIECYPIKKLEEVPDEETAFPLRHLPFHAVIIVHYNNPATEKAANNFGVGIRSIMREGSGMERPQVYVNFATGDETAEELYGYDGRVEKLKTLKAKWDPEGHFNQYNSFCK